jgi:multiple sugar transport system ATP-binding protein
MKRKPRQLSGGQQQRVALGRCIVRNPLVFLFDEPLSNLDAKLRAQMRIEIKRLHAQVPTTSVFVTHDQVEAMTLGDRIVVMRDGRVQQVGTPLSVYSKPVNRFVAAFSGAPAMTFIEVRDGPDLAVSADGLRLVVTEPATRALEAYRGRKVILGMRPEHLMLGDGAEGRSADCVVEVVEQLGSEILLEARLGSTRITAARVPAETPIAAGDRVRLSVPPGRLHFFDSESGRAIVG